MRGHVRALVRRDMSRRGKRRRVAALQINTPAPAPTEKINAKTQRSQGAKNKQRLPCVFAALRLCVKSDVGKTDRRHRAAQKPRATGGNGQRLEEKVECRRPKTAWTIVRGQAACISLRCARARNSKIIHRAHPSRQEGKPRNFSRGFG